MRRAQAAGVAGRGPPGAQPAAAAGAQTGRGAEGAGRVLREGHLLGQACRLHHARPRPAAPHGQPPLPLVRCCPPPAAAVGVRESSMFSNVMKCHWAICGYLYISSAFGNMSALLQLLPTAVGSRIFPRKRADLLSNCTAKRWFLSCSALHLSPGQAILELVMQASI